MNGISRFGFSDTAKLAIEAALALRARIPITTQGWSDEEFADQLTRWLVQEGLMPAHVTPADFRRFV